MTALSDEGGQIAAQMAFDSWGQRRNGNDWNTVWQQWTMGMTPVWAQSAIDITPRGFTGHEHVDEMGIIHMNGRIYDALLGRFLQADPFVEDSTTLNRYTYVHNNPLSLTDPSGFFSFKKAFKLAAVVAISVYTGGLAQAALLAKEFALGFTYAVLGGALAGGISAGGIEGAVWGAFSGAVFFGIGVGFNQVADPTGGLFNTGLSGPEFAAQSISPGLAGGTISEMQGGKFGHGFLSAGISKAATPGVAASPLNNYQQGFVLAIIGGTTSKISGGKFANGAVTAAMSFSFGQLAQRSATGNDQTGLLSMSDDEIDALIDSQFDQDAFLNRDFLLAECGGCVQQGIMQREFLAGRITEDQLLRFHTAQGSGVIIGLSLISGGQGLRLGFRFGHRGLFARGGILNKGRHFRIGEGRRGGERVFRIAGESLGKVPPRFRQHLGIKQTGPNQFKLDLFDLGPL